MGADASQWDSGNATCLASRNVHGKRETIATWTTSTLPTSKQMLSLMARYTITSNRLFETALGLGASLVSKAQIEHVLGCSVESCAHVRGHFGTAQEVDSHPQGCCSAVLLPVLVTQTKQLTGRYCEGHVVQYTLWDRFNPPL